MAEQIRKNIRTREDDTPTPEPDAPAVAPSSSLAAVDSLLDEIDSILETNAEQFVAGFVQKGGQ